MAVLDERAFSGAQGRKFGEYVVVSVLAVALGVAAALGFQAITTEPSFGPAQIEQARAAELADHLQNRWIADVNAARNADLIEFYKAPFMERVARIQEQRAADLVEHHAAQYRGELAAIHDQRARDMVELRYGDGR